VQALAAAGGFRRRETNETFNNHTAVEMQKANVFRVLIRPCAKFLIPPGYDEGDSWTESPFFASKIAFEVQYREPAVLIARCRRQWLTDL